MFVHLRIHSAYSLAEGAIKVPEIPLLCQDYQMPAVGICDTANLFGALEIASACAKQGIQPIIGCQLHLKDEKGTLSHLPVLSKTREGYQNLIKIVSDSYLKTSPTDEATVTWDTLQGRTAGLIALTGGHQGLVGHHLLHGQTDKALEVLRRLKHLFPYHLYVELQRHGLPQQEAIEENLVTFAYEQDLPLVATNNVFFPHRQMYRAHDALLCIAEGTYVSDQDRRRVTPEHYFKSSKEMEALFADLPEAIQNTVIIAQRCSFMPEAAKPKLPPFPTESGRTESEELWHQAHEGLERRLQEHVFKDGDTPQQKEAVRKTYLDRLAYELKIIDSMGFPGYFLIVSDFIKWAKSQNIPVGPGRGSGAGSLVAWATMITDMDPIRFSLIFERFLNPERVSMPDFDIDFCQDRRDEVIGYVVKKYGMDKVAHIITFGKLQARAVLRDVGRVLQLPYGQVDKICKLVPNNPANPVPLKQAVENDPFLQQARDSEPAVAEMMDIGIQLEGLYRHASTHAAGVVIGGQPLHEDIPLYKDEKSNLPVTQFNMKYVELAGLLKFDFLGLKTLTVIQHACDMAKKKGFHGEIGRIPLDDLATFKLLCAVETVGVFQLEGSGMRDVLRRMQPDRFEDLIALVALYRPGPMDDIPRYLACKHGEEEVTYLHPDLKPILEMTYGVMVYQEQVMQIAQKLGGYSLGGADLLRRAMGKKIAGEMDAQRQIFTEGAIKNGVEEGIARQIFDQMAKFAGYGFNKSHSAPYGLLAYQTAYLKANYPAEFYAASMTYDMHNTDKLSIYKQDMERANIPLLPPDLNSSFATFQVEGEGVRYALGAIKNVGVQAMEEIVKERLRKGPFRSLEDFALRIDPSALNKRQLENLIAAGAFDSLSSNRHQTYRMVETILRNAALETQERKSLQGNLFAFAQSTPQVQLTYPPIPDWGPLDKAQKEFEALGFFLSSHPLDIYGEALKKLGVINSRSLSSQKEGVVNLVGVILSKQERASKTGQKFAFVQLSDSGGPFEVALFSHIYLKSREMLVSGAPIFVSAMLRREGEEARLTAQELKSLDSVMQSTVRVVKIIVDESVSPGELRRLIEQGGPGALHIEIEILLENSPPVQIYLPQTYAFPAHTRSQLLALEGVQAVEER